MSEGTRWEAEAGGRTVTNPERPPGTPQVQIDIRIEVNAVTMALNAPPMMTPTAISRMLPREMKALNSDQTDLADFVKSLFFLAIRPSFYRRLYFALSCLFS